MVNTCAVAICPSPRDTSYHKFPSDEALQKVWVARCHRKDPINVKTAHICSTHFKSEDFDRDLRNELLQLPPRKLLKPNSIPTLLLCPGK